MCECRWCVLGIHLKALLYAMQTADVRPASVWQFNCNLSQGAGTCSRPCGRKIFCRNLRTRQVPVSLHDGYKDGNLLALCTWCYFDGKKL